MSEPDNLKICFDRILPRDLSSPQLSLLSNRNLRGIIAVGKLWPNGSTLRIRFIDGTAEQRNTVKQYAPEWTQHANLIFEFNDAPDAEIRIAFDPSAGSWSYLGTDCQSIPRDQPTMNLGWLDRAVVLHEFGHAIGLHHEHQNPLGGIQWNRENVIRDLSGPPNYWNVEQIEFNVLKKYDQDQIRGTTFDPDSIMLYPFPASWTVNGQGTKENTELSAQDKDFIASAQAYPGRTPQVVELAVNASQATQASIGQPGEEDMFKFTATTQGIYTIETGGETDVVMKLYGPNSRTQLIAEDDDSGVGNNAKIIRPLLSGDYFVQIRHYNTAGGTGAYTIKVTSSPTDKVVIYADANYQGASNELGVGSYELSTLSIGNDMLSSLKVPLGMKVTLYEHAEFTGRTKTFSSDTAWVGDEFNDLTSSIKVELA